MKACHFCGMSIDDSPTGIVFRSTGGKEVASPILHDCKQVQLDELKRRIAELERYIYPKQKEDDDD